MAFIHFSVGASSLKKEQYTGRENVSQSDDEIKI